MQTTGAGSIEEHCTALLFVNSRTTYRICVFTILLANFWLAYAVLAKKNFLLFLTEGYFNSKFCMLELRARRDLLA